MALQVQRELAALTTNTQSDPHELEADRVVAQGTRGVGQPLDDRTRAFMEDRIGHDFAAVRVHTDPSAAESAAGISARAYTVGRDVVFASGEYAPGTREGRKLLAHELTHTAQQGAAHALRPSRQSAASRQLALHGAPATNVVQRAPTGEKEVGKAAATRCPVKCGGDAVGTLYALPLVHLIYDADPAKGQILDPKDPTYANADGIGAALHFFKSATGGKKAGACDCEQFKIIQVVDTTHNVRKTGDPEGPDTFLDINQTEVEQGKKEGKAPTPYYGDWAKNRHDRAADEVPAGYPHAGDKVTAEHSIYDRPARRLKSSLKDGKDFTWRAESRVVCIKKGQKPKVLGGVAWGFGRQYDKTKSAYKPIIDTPPKCTSGRSTPFEETLKKDQPDYTFDAE